jgi:hypothetical protein
MAWTTPGTATAGEVLTASFWNTQVRDQFTELAPFMTAWTSYTPTLGGFTLGNGTLTGAYLKVGRMVMVRVKFIFGSTSGTANFMTISLPSVAAAANQSEIFGGNVLLVDSGGSRYMGAVINGTSSSNVEILAVNTAGTYATVPAIQATVPFTWSTNDEVFLRLTYEATS